MKPQKPINVQLTKDDLKELLGVVRNLVLEELSNQSRRLFLNNSENAKEITAIKARENINGVTLDKELSDLKGYICCGVKCGHFLTVVRIYAGNQAALFCCIKCDLEYSKDSEDFNEKEKELVRIVLGEKK